MPANQPDNLHLTDFLDLPTLQEIQDSFAAVANVRARITDADGNFLTDATPAKEFIRRQRAIAAAEAGDADAPEGPQRKGGEYIAPIIVNNQRLGSIRMSAAASAAFDEEKLAGLAQKVGLDPAQMKTVVAQLHRSRGQKPAAIQFLYLLANALARLCYQEFQLRQRINEMTAIYNVTMMLADARDLSRVLQRTAKVVCDVMNVKASSIRLLDTVKDELVISAVHNLSQEYLNKGAIRFSTAQIDREALSERGYAYVANMSGDARVLFPHESQMEGIVSMLSVGMRYKGKPVGVLRVYSAQEQAFTQLQIDLMKAVAAQAAAAIENARLLAETLAAEALERQVQMAVDVQQRMIPQKPPAMAAVDLAAVYVPCFGLGGDWYDFIPLPDDNVGLVIADVSGKGVPASLIMASVRASLRAHVHNVYYLYEVMRKVNEMLCQDTKPSEFVTLFYGVFDTRNRRLTYCNAGHPPGLLLRAGKVSELSSNNMVLGVDPLEQYEQRVVDLRPGDTLLLYTDGLTDATNFEQQQFGKQRVLDAFAAGGKSADAIAQHILWEMRRFVGLSDRCDDVTMMVARVK